MWTCPVCLQVPKKEIFQCSIGHSFCGTCKLHLTKCPMCRAPNIAIRNFLAEELLDKMTFECPWKERGCLDLVTREDLPVHDELCKNGLLFLCGKTTHFTKCQFSCSIPYSYNNTAVSVLLDHMKNVHGCPTRKHCSYDTVVNISLNTRKLRKLAETNFINTLSHVFLDFSTVSIVNNDIPTSVTVMAVNRAHLIDQSQLVLSWTFVLLTYTEDISKFSIHVIFTNKDNTTSKSTTKLIHASEFRKYLSQTEKQKTYCPHSVVFEDLQTISTNTDDVLRLSFILQQN